MRAKPIEPPREVRRERTRAEVVGRVFEVDCGGFFWLGGCFYGGFGVGYHFGGLNLVRLGDWKGGEVGGCASCDGGEMLGVWGD